MEFMTVKQAEEKWGLSERRLQTICNEGRIPGVVKFGRAWAIPMNAEKGAKFVDLYKCCDKIARNCDSVLKN